MVDYVSGGNELKCNHTFSRQGAGQTSFEQRRIDTCQLATFAFVLHATFNTTHNVQEVSNSI
jgi:hypothetical protein